MSWSRDTIIFIGATLSIGNRILHLPFFGAIAFSQLVQQPNGAKGKDICTFSITLSLSTSRFTLPYMCIRCLYYLYMELPQTILLTEKSQYLTEQRWNFIIRVLWSIKLYLDRTNLDSVGGLKKQSYARPTTDATPEHLLERLKPKLRCAKILIATSTYLPINRFHTLRPFHSCKSEAIFLAYIITYLLQLHLNYSTILVATRRWRVA